ncbi:MAG: hypothetical protein AAFN79_17195 [Pseudomonadota bacterium]
MTATDIDAPRGPRLGSVRRWMQAILIGQAALAAGLIWADATSLDWSDGEVVTRPVVPVAPGDQTRRYDPAAVPGREDRGRRPDAPLDLPREMGQLTFRFVDSDAYGRIMALEGAIAPGDAQRFDAALADAETPPVFVSLHSPGGSLSDALAIGKAVREAGLNTLVVADGACVSACPTILFGGVERHVSADAWIGMHQSYLANVSMIATRRAVSQVQTLQGEVIGFARDMGVDPGVHVHALTTPPEDVYFLLPEQIEEYRVATTLIADE